MTDLRHHAATVQTVRSGPHRRRAVASLACAAVVVTGMACSASRDDPDMGDGRDPIVSQTTTRDGSVRGGGTVSTAPTGDRRTTTTGKATVPPGAPTGPIGASGQDDGGDPGGSSVQGAEPGQDIDDLRPPGGTYGGTPDPGGDSASDPPRRTG